MPICCLVSITKARLGRRWMKSTKQVRMLLWYSFGTQEHSKQCPQIVVPALVPMAVTKCLRCRQYYTQQRLKHKKDLLLNTNEILILPPFLQIQGSWKYNAKDYEIVQSVQQQRTRKRTGKIFVVIPDRTRILWLTKKNGEQRMKYFLDFRVTNLTIGVDPFVR